MQPHRQRVQFNNWRYFYRPDNVARLRRVYIDSPTVLGALSGLNDCFPSPHSLASPPPQPRIMLLTVISQFFLQSPSFWRHLCRLNYFPLDVCVCVCVCVWLSVCWRHGENTCRAPPPHPPRAQLSSALFMNTHAPRTEWHPPSKLSIFPSPDKLTKMFLSQHLSPSLPQSLFQQKVGIKILP